ncbi:Chromo domain protein [Pseudocohnilembus persalinus]|uniref:Chromo domain protein n=1 Tax=Pseudocohnilembus persalinus TaxID=266149 RepID=A0A0V0QGJ9_PSEPJ|nr:Chromo domain protein [Pseudocohnilembus persalinus]|eukprot:KRX01303.1 Chromo domain protein [Pseudocohnilembus persalinus]
MGKTKKNISIPIEQTDIVENQEEQENYLVEKVVGKQSRYGKVYYQIKWSGYDSEDNTWEPLEHLDQVKYLIKQYENEQEQKKLLEKANRINSRGQKRKQNQKIQKNRKLSPENTETEESQVLDKVTKKPIQINQSFQF